MGRQGMKRRVSRRRASGDRGPRPRRRPQQGPLPLWRIAVVWGLALTALGTTVFVLLELRDLKETSDLPRESVTVISSEPTGDWERRRRRSCSVDRTVYRSDNPPPGMPSVFTGVGCYEGDIGQRQTAARDVRADGTVDVILNPPQSAAKTLKEGLLVALFLFPVAVLVVALRESLSRRTGD